MRNSDNKKYDRMLDMIKEMRPFDGIDRLEKLVEDINLDKKLSILDQAKLVDKAQTIEFRLLLPRDDYGASVPSNQIGPGLALFKKLKLFDEKHAVLTDKEFADLIHNILDQADGNDQIQGPVYDLVYGTGVEMLEKYGLEDGFDERIDEAAGRAQVAWELRNQHEAVEMGKKLRSEPKMAWTKLHNEKMMYYHPEEDELNITEGWGPAPDHAIARLRCKDRPSELTLQIAQNNRVFAPDMNAAKDIFEVKAHQCLEEGLCKVSFQYIRPEDFLMGCPPICAGDTALETPDQYFNLDDPNYVRLKGRMLHGEDIDPVWLDLTKPWVSQFSDTCPVWCHEGRHRAKTAIREGIGLIPAIVVEPNNVANEVFYEQCLRIKKERRIKIDDSEREF